MREELAKPARASIIISQIPSDVDSKDPRVRMYMYASVYMRDFRVWTRSIGIILKTQRGPRSSLSLFQSNII